MNERKKTDSTLQTFLQRMSLRTGAEIITYLQIINKVSGVYGLLAIITGASIDGFRVGMVVAAGLAFAGSAVAAVGIVNREDAPAEVSGQAPAPAGN